MQPKKTKKNSTTVQTAKQFLKRDMQPSFPTGMKVSKAESIMIIDFLTSQESLNYDRSFSSIIVNKDVAKDLMINLINFIHENNFSSEEFGIEINNTDGVTEIES